MEEERISFTLLGNRQNQNPLRAAVSTPAAALASIKPRAIPIIMASKDMCIQFLFINKFSYMNSSFNNTLFFNFCEKMVPGKVRDHC